MAMTKEFIAKLAEACDAVGGVEKRGRNVQQGYDYVKAADVAKAIRHELFSRGIVLLQNEIEPTFIEYQTAKGTRGLDCRIGVQFILTDGESEKELVAWGQAMDTSDKSIYKAKTGCLKYFLRGLGLIPDEKEDPERESPDAAFDKAKYTQEKIAELSAKPNVEEPKDDNYEWRQRIKNCATVEDFNKLFPDADKASGETKAWIITKSKALGFAYDRSLHCFYDPDAERHEKLTNDLKSSVDLEESLVDDTPQPEAPSSPPQRPSMPAEVASGKQTNGLKLISKAQEIRIHEAKKESGATDDYYYNVLGRYGAEHAKELQRANFQPVLLALLDLKRM